jgi:tetratricopeptide (TPR) repeat protein
MRPAVFRGVPVVVLVSVFSFAGQLANRQAKTSPPNMQSPEAAENRNKEKGDDDAQKIEKARQCIHEDRDRRAFRLLREVLRHNPSNHEARLEMAVLLGYGEDFRNSDRMYRELLAENPADEAAALGLIHNLMREQLFDQARSELQRALSYNRNSIVLQEYSDQLQPGHRIAAEAIEIPKFSVEVGGGYFSDSAGNRVLESSQTAEYRITRLAIGRLWVDEQKLWKSASPEANALAGTGSIELRPSKFISITSGGGAVRFADLSSRSIYSSDLVLRPQNTLSLFGGYSQFPFSPTYDAAQFDLLAQGWHTGLDWHPKIVRIRSSFSRAHYSDGNRAESERGEIIHWTHGSSVAVGGGYEFTHSHFRFDPLHGYFSPTEYRRHVGELGLRFKIGKVIRAEYLGRAGVESISNGSYTPAGELRLRHRVFIQRWQLGLDYSRFQVTQSTGAFQANSASGFLSYDFSKLW